MRQKLWKSDIVMPVWQKMGRKQAISCYLCESSFFSNSISLGIAYILAISHRALKSRKKLQFGRSYWLLCLPQRPAKINIFGYFFEWISVRGKIPETLILAFEVIIMHHATTRKRSVRPISFFSYRPIPITTDISNFLIGRNRCWYWYAFSISTIPIMVTFFSSA